jgi:hypothetical protein
MNIFEKIATFLFRLLGAWGVITGAQSLVWYEMYHLGIWSKPEYSPSWAIPAVISMVGGILLFVFSRRLGRLFGGDLQ